MFEWMMELCCRQVSIIWSYKRLTFMDTETIRWHSSLCHHAVTITHLLWSVNRCVARSTVEVMATESHRTKSAAKKRQTKLWQAWKKKIQKAHNSCSPFHPLENKQKKERNCEDSPWADDVQSVNKYRAFDVTSIAIFPVSNAQTGNTLNTDVDMYVARASTISDYPQNTLSITTIFNGFFCRSIDPHSRFAFSGL